MPSKSNTIFFQVPVEDEAKVDSYLVELSARGVVEEVRQGDGILTCISATGKQEISVLHYYLTVRGSQSQVREIAKTLLERHIVPKGRKWTVLCGIDPR